MNKRRLRWKHRIPKRFVPVLFPFLLSGFMTLLITDISIVKVVGTSALVSAPFAFFQSWMKTYVSAWILAYPVLLLAIPVVRRAVNTLITNE